MVSSPSNFTIQQHTPTAITAAKPPIVTIVNHGFVQGECIRCTRFVTMPFAMATGMEQLNGNLYYVGSVTTDTFGLYDVNSLPIDGTNYTPFVSNGLAQMTLVGQDLWTTNPAPDPPPGVPPLPIPERGYPPLPGNNPPNPWN